MKRGFELLKTRNPNDKPDISKLERKYGIIVPPIYRLFTETFSLGELITEKFYSDQYHDYYNCGYIEYAPLPLKNKRFLSITKFIEITELFPEWDFSKTEKEWTQYSLLRITDIGMGGGLFLGTKDDMKDGIYRVVWDWDEPYEKVAENIFEFVQGLSFVEDEENMYGVKLGELYRLWNEDFWRIKS